MKHQIMGGEVVKAAMTGGGVGPGTWEQIICGAFDGKSHGKECPSN